MVASTKIFQMLIIMTFNLAGYASSCKELKKMSGLRRDGDYKLLIQGRLLQVYCHGMRKSKPREYLTLPAGEKENFSEIYEKR